MLFSRKHLKESVTSRLVIETPLGLINLFFSDRGLMGLVFAAGNDRKQEASADPAAAIQALPKDKLKTWQHLVVQALEDFFSGKPIDIKALPLDLQGSAFHLKVWRELQKIPYGAKISYKELAARAGSPKGFRAVGQANGANPIPLIIPCHRVIAADGSLGGYSSGLHRKKWLMEHEKAI